MSKGCVFRVFASIYLNLVCVELSTISHSDSAIYTYFLDCSICPAVLRISRIIEYQFKRVGSVHIHICLNVISSNRGGIFAHTSVRGSYRCQPVCEYSFFYINVVSHCIFGCFLLRRRTRNQWNWIKDRKSHSIQYVWIWIVAAEGVDSFLLNKVYTECFNWVLIWIVIIMGTIKLINAWV